MVAIDFPAAPILDQEVVLAGTTYIYNGQGWMVKPAATGGTGEPPIAPGLVTDYWRGDKTWQLLPVGEPPIAPGLITDYWRGDKTWQPLFTGHGQCRLNGNAGINELRLVPYNGNKLFINGKSETVPSAGVVISGAGLAVETIYYVYAFMVGTVMTLEAVTAAHGPHTNGVEIKVGDPTRTLVGMCKLSTAGQIDNYQDRKNVRSWFNETSAVAMMTNQSPVSVAASSIILFPAATFDFQMLLWNGETINVHISGDVSCDIATAIAQTNMERFGLGGGTALPLSDQTTHIPGVNFQQPVSVSYATAVGADELMRIRFVGTINAGVGTWHPALTASIRSSR